MIKAKGVQNGREVFMIGLSFSNLDKLRQDMPVVIHKEEVNIPFDIIVFSLETENDMAEVIKPLLTHDAIITDSFNIRPKKN